MCSVGIIGLWGIGNFHPTIVGSIVGVDGVGILNQSGGTLTTPWVVLDNRVSTTVNGTISQYNLTGGTLNLTQQFGLRSNNVATGVMTWSGATIRNAASAIAETSSRPP